MKNACPYLPALVLSFVIGCSSPKPAPILFGGTVADTRAYLDNYKHVLLVCITGDQLKRALPPEKPEVHCCGTVVRAYKGDWEVGETVSWVSLTELAETETVEPNEPKGKLMFVFTDMHSDQKLFLDAGDAPWWSEEMERQIESFLK